VGLGANRNSLTYVFPHEGHEPSTLLTVQERALGNHCVHSSTIDQQHQRVILERSRVVGPCNPRVQRRSLEVNASIRKAETIPFRELRIAIVEESDLK